eukprot:jgi/Hompol1/4934/HPOL_004046-RA
MPLLSNTAVSPSQVSRGPTPLSNGAKWRPHEDTILTEAVERLGTEGQWEAIAACLPGRSMVQCRKRWSSLVKPRRGKWMAEEDDMLLSAYGTLMRSIDASDTVVNSIFWNKVAEAIPGRSGQQCMARYTEALDPSVKKGKWAPEEDVLLRKGFSQYGKVWVRVAEMIPGRTQRQCRTRWMLIRRYDSKATQELATETAASEEAMDDGDDHPTHGNPDNSGNSGNLAAAASSSSGRINS